MADVARHAGVSAQTVSRVSNGHTNVDDSTREKVLASMRALGYRPNGAARALKSGRFHTVGVIMFTLETLGNVRTLDAIAGRSGESRLFGHAHAGPGPHARCRLRRLPSADPTGRRRGHHHLRGVTPRSGRDLAAARAARRRHRLERRIGLLGGRRRPGTGSPSGHRAPARARPPTGLAHRRTPILLLGDAPSRVVARHADAARASTPPEPLYGDWTTESGLPARTRARTRCPTSPRSSPRTIRWPSAR